MKRDVIVVDNFYRDPDAIVRYAAGLKFYNPWAYNEKGSSAPEDMAKATWHASFFKKAKDCPFKSSEHFISTLERITGEEIDRDHWNKDFPESPLDGAVLEQRPDFVDPDKGLSFANLIPNAVSCRWNAVFHAKYSVQPPGTGVHNHVRDVWSSVGEDGWAGLIYLNKDAPRDSGLKTYRNKHGDDYEWMTDASRWQLLDDYANVYNRLILVRGSMPHVGGSGFGHSFMTGRRFQTLFFKSKKVENFSSVDIKLPQSLLSNVKHWLKA